ncbi:MAG: hypothetical protein CMI52_03765 [Parcubacteria group bacterium]|nr:hypothetical protein [Parcubacteria group bacterium]|tara:strand:+ start:24 stop:563 length:540 start_codon:yes stop_codon:yes gene_type:complete
MFGVDFSVVLLIILGLFAFAGFWFGLLHTIGALIGTILGAFLASKFHGWGASVLLGKFDLNENTAQVLGFLLVFVLVSRTFGLSVWLIEKIINASGIVPFFGMLNRTSGAVVGLIEGVMIVGLVLSFSMQFPITDKWKPQIEKSGVAQSTMNASKLLWPVVTKSISFFDELPDELNLID